MFGGSRGVQSICLLIYDVLVMVRYFIFVCVGDNVLRMRVCVCLFNCGKVTLSPLYEFKICTISRTFPSGS